MQSALLCSRDLCAECHVPDASDCICISGAALGISNTRRLALSCAPCACQVPIMQLVWPTFQTARHCRCMSRADGLCMLQGLTSLAADLPGLHPADAQPYQQTTLLDNRVYIPQIKFFSVLISIPVLLAFFASIYYPFLALLRLGNRLGSYQVLHLLCQQELPAIACYG